MEIIVQGIKNRYIIPKLRVCAVCPPSLVLDSTVAAHMAHCATACAMPLSIKIAVKTRGVSFLMRQSYQEFRRFHNDIMQSCYSSTDANLSRSRSRLSGRTRVSSNEINVSVRATPSMGCILSFKTWRRSLVLRQTIFSRMLYEPVM